MRVPEAGQPAETKKPSRRGAPTQCGRTFPGDVKGEEMGGGNGLLGLLLFLWLGDGQGDSGEQLALDGGGRRVLYQQDAPLPGSWPPPRSSRCWEDYQKDLSLFN